MLMEHLSNRMNFLKYSAPDTNGLVTLAVVLSILAVGILLYAFFPQLYRAVSQCSGKEYLTIFCEGFPMFTLFMVYFGWTSIQQTSNFLMGGLLLAAIWGHFLTKSKGKKQARPLLVFLLSFFVLSQMEPGQMNDFQPSIIRVDFIHDLVASLSSQFLLSLYILNVLVEKWRQ